MTLSVTTKAFRRNVPFAAAGVALLLTACAGTTRNRVSVWPASKAPEQTGEPVWQLTNADAPAPASTNDHTNSSAQASAPAGLPVHSQAPDLGTIQVSQAPADVDTGAVFRPTMARSETVETATPNVTRITYAEEGADFDPSLSRDGQTLVFASTAHRATADVYVKKINSRVVTQLTNDPSNDMMPELSPDGSHVAFASDRGGNWDVYIMPAAGGKAVQVSFDTADEISPSWSPDGTQLVYCKMGQMSGRWEMWIADIEKPEIANFIGFGLFPQWCPVAATGQDGADRILYQLGRERGRRTYGVWTMDITVGQAGNATEIRSSSTNALITPSWSPDGKWIVMAEVPLEVGDAESDPFNALHQTDLRTTPQVSSLFLTSVDNEAPVRLTFPNRLALSPAWSRGNRLYFVSNGSGVENIWSLDMTNPVATAQALIQGQSDAAFATQPEDEGVEETAGDRR